MKNKNTKNTKKNTKNQKTQTPAPVSENATPATATTTIEVTPAAPAPVVPKPETRGRKDGSSSLSLVNKEDFVALLSSLPATFDKLPLSNNLIKSLSKIGYKLNSTPFKATEMQNIVNTAKQPAPIETPVASEVAA